MYGFRLREILAFVVVAASVLPTPAFSQSQPKQANRRPGQEFSQVSLPPRSDAGGISIGQASHDSVVSILNPKWNRLEFVIKPVENQSAWNINDSAREIASVVRENGDLRLKWAANAPADAECLRNVVLRIEDERGVRHVALREPVEIEAPIVDLSKTRQTITPDLRLWGMAHKSLVLEGSGTTDNNPPVEAIYPADKRAPFRGKVRIVVRDKPPHAGVQLSLVAADDQPTIRVEPIIIDFEDNPQPWTVERLKRMYVSLARAVQNLERNIPAGKTTVSSLESQLSGLRRQYRSDRLDAPLIANAIGRTESDLARAKSKLASWETALPINRERLKGMQPLDPLSKSVHQKARVTFRVFFLADDQEVDLLLARSGVTNE